jgi:hypothetical protein
MNALYEARLEESKLTKHAKTLGLKLLAPEAVTTLHGSFRRQPAIRIPYFTPEGKPTNFYRLRYLGTAPGFAGAAEKQQRYAQEPNTLNDVYLPPLLKRPWRDILRDPKEPIIFTEGEFKSACGCAHGFPVIGLGGVDVFRSKKREQTDLLPVLAEAEWNQRQVFIVWDSDVAVKEGPIAAQRALAYRLMRRGALPRLLGLPGGVGKEKVGLDDYLLKHSAKDLGALLETSQTYEEAGALWEMNEECVFVMSPPLIIARRPTRLDDLYMKPRDFTDAQYANRVILVDGKPKSVAKQWLAWPKRFEVEGMTYAPSEERIVDGRWNAWRGWGVDASPGDIKPFLALVDFLLQYEAPEAKRWFLQWLAYPIQHPGAKVRSACLFWGVEGSGKSFIGEIMRDIYGHANSSKVGNEQLHNTFNKWAFNKQFILAEEVTGSDKRSDADRLKDMITGETVTINEKYLPAIVLRDTANFYLTSNHANALYLGDRDRRYFVVHVTEKESDAFYKVIDKWRADGGPAALRYFLEHLDLAGFNSMASAYVTSAKEAMISDSRSEMARWVYEMKENTKQVLMGLNNAKAAEHCDLYTPAQLFQVYNPDRIATHGTVNGLSRELRGANVFKAHRGGKIMTRSGTVTLFIVRNKDKWIKASPKDCAEHWEGFWLGKKHHAT